MGGTYCKRTGSRRLWSVWVCLCVVTAPADWQARNVYTAAFFEGCYFIFWNEREDETPVSSQFSDAWGVSCTHPLDSVSLTHMHTRRLTHTKACSHNSWLLTTHAAEFPKHPRLFCGRDKQGRAWPGIKKVLATTRRPRPDLFHYVIVWKSPNGCSSPPPPTSPQPRYTHPPRPGPLTLQPSSMSSGNFSPRSGYSPITKKPRGQLESTNFHTQRDKHAKESTIIHHKDVWKGN